MTVSTESSDVCDSQGMLVSSRKRLCILTGSVGQGGGLWRKDAPFDTLREGVLDVIEEACPDFKVNKVHEVRVKSNLHDLREKGMSGPPTFGPRPL